VIFLELKLLEEIKERCSTNFVNR